MHVSNRHNAHSASPPTLTLDPVIDLTNYIPQLNPKKRRTIYSAYPSTYSTSTNHDNKDNQSIDMTRSKTQTKLTNQFEQFELIGKALQQKVIKNSSAKKFEKQKQRNRVSTNKGNNKSKKNNNDINISAIGYSCTKLLEQSPNKTLKIQLNTLPTQAIVIKPIHHSRIMTELDIPYISQYNSNKNNNQITTIASLKRFKIIEEKKKKSNRSIKMEVAAECENKSQNEGRKTDHSRQGRVRCQTAHVPNADRNQNRISLLPNNRFVKSSLNQELQTLKQKQNLIKQNNRYQKEIQFKQSDIIQVNHIIDDNRLRKKPKNTKLCVKNRLNTNDSKCRYSLSLSSVKYQNPSVDARNQSRINAHNRRKTIDINLLSKNTIASQNQYQLQYISKKQNQTINLDLQEITDLHIDLNQLRPQEKSQFNYRQSNDDKQKQSTNKQKSLQVQEVKDNILYCPFFWQNQKQIRRKIDKIRNIKRYHFQDNYITL